MLTSPSGFPQLQRGYLTRGQALVLTTDGIGDGMGGPASGYLHAHLARPLAAHELLRVGSFTTFQSDDDRGMFVAWC